MKQLRPLAPIAIYRGYRRGPHWRVLIRRTGELREFQTFEEACQFIRDVLRGVLSDVRWWRA